MPAHTTARTLTVDDNVGKPFSRLELVQGASGTADRAEREEHERRQYITMIEAMVRAGHSEAEITRAVERAQRTDR